VVVEPQLTKILYVKVPELSVDGSQASVTRCGVRDVTRRFAGLVGGLRSPAAKAVEVPKNETSTARIAAATLAVRQNGIVLIMLYLQSPHKKLCNRRAAV
jgi:hypothetical protein